LSADILAEDILKHRRLQERIVYMLPTTAVDQWPFIGHRIVNQFPIIFWSGNKPISISIKSQINGLLMMDAAYPNNTSSKELHYTYTVNINDFVLIGL